MFVCNPDPYLLPSYRFSPFKTDYVGINSNLPSDDFCISYLNNKFGIKNWMFTINGREAIEIALKNYQLKETDVVTFLTTSENFYISSCVTNTIEKFCSWSRAIVPQTKVILVNHEFGYPHPSMEKLVATGLPIIEDCCTTFFSQDSNNKIGKYGDFSAYSLPKFFPMQIGGIVVNNTKNNKIARTIISKEEEEYIRNVLSFQLKNESELLKMRKAVFDYASNLFLELSFTCRFDSNENIVPYALVLKNNSVIQDLNLMKKNLTNHGVQNSIFYGEDAFFMPVHQNLTKVDINYFYTCLQNFITSETNV